MNYYLFLRVLSAIILVFQEVLRARMKIAKLASNIMCNRIHECQAYVRVHWFEEVWSKSYAVLHGKYTTNSKETSINGSGVELLFFNLILKA